MLKLNDLFLLCPVPLLWFLKGWNVLKPSLKVVNLRYGHFWWQERWVLRSEMVEKLVCVHYALVQFRIGVDASGKKWISWTNSSCWWISALQNFEIFVPDLEKTKPRFAFWRCSVKQFVYLWRVADVAAQVALVSLDEVDIGRELGLLLVQSFFAQ